jgi:hypothetical protein
MDNGAAAGRYKQLCFNATGAQKNIHGSLSFVSKDCSPKVYATAAEKVKQKVTELCCE